MLNRHRGVTLLFAVLLPSVLFAGSVDGTNVWIGAKGGGSVFHTGLRYTPKPKRALFFPQTYPQGFLRDSYA